MFHLTRSPAALITYQPLADELGARVGARPPVAEATAAVLANRRRGLLLDPTAPTPARPDRSSSTTRHLGPGRTIVGCRLPVHTDSDGQLRASAGWLLEHIGYRPGHNVADGIRCSERRTLTRTAHGGATAMGFAQALTELSAQVEAATGITLHPEPVLTGTWP
ncbi:hypothetical protein [Kitasatospora sp. NPDC059599]|uniref:hypothetical protein n=1 Tax=Kitasatospora sp. NPDC059599 TaxID=3346880 RepID=UPI0036D1413E